MFYFILCLWDWRNVNLGFLLFNKSCPYKFIPMLSIYVFLVIYIQLTLYLILSDKKFKSLVDEYLPTEKDNLDAKMLVKLLHLHLCILNLLLKCHFCICVFLALVIYRSFSFGHLQKFSRILVFIVFPENFVSSTEDIFSFRVLLFITTDNYIF